MMNCHFNHGETDPFKENRLVFRGGKFRARGRAGFGKKKKKESPSGDVPSDDEVLKMTGGLLEDLHAEVDEKDKPKYHRMRRDTSELREPPKRYEETPKVLERELAMKGFLRPEMLQLIQKTHERIYDHYLNPGFWIALRKNRPQSEMDTIQRNMDMVIAQPYAFEYKVGENGMVEIRNTDREDNIPDDFLIRLETDRGYITQVGKIRLREKGKDIPWMDSDEYIGQMPHFFMQTENAIDRVALDPENVRKILEIRDDPSRTIDQKIKEIVELFFNKPYKELAQHLKEIYMENIHALDRVIKVVDGRKIPFEAKDPRVLRLKRGKTLQAKTYEELTQGLEPKDEVLLYGDILTVDGLKTPVYMFQDRSPDLIIMTKEGFFINQNADGTYSFDPRYDRALIDRYYGENPKAKAALSEAKKLELERAKADATALDKKLAEEKEQLEKRREMRKKIDGRLPTASISTLKDVAKAVTPHLAGQIDQFADREENRKPLTDGIKSTLDSDPTKTEAAAAVLGITP